MKRKRIVNKKLCKSYHNKQCLACTEYHTETTAGHHIQTVGAGGDDIEENLMPVCNEHHREVEKSLADFANKYPHVEDFLLAMGWEFDGYSNKWFHHRMRR